MGPKFISFPHFPAISFAFLCFLAAQFHSSAASPPSIYDHLRANGLPAGLFPEGISDFQFNSTSGEFRFNLTQPCDAKFENQLHYDFNISGVLSFGKIGALSGMSQQELFLWFPVKGIRVDVPSSGLIYFDVGVVDKQFSLSLFENPIECTAADEDFDSRGSNYFELWTIFSRGEHTVLPNRTASTEVVHTLRGEHSSVPGMLASKSGQEDLRADS